MKEWTKPKKLTDEERATYQWQIWTPGYGEKGQGKLISGMEPSLVGKMLYCDMQHMSFQEIAISRKPDCPICRHLFHSDT